MAIDRAPFNALVDDDGSGLTGTVWNKAQINAVLLTPIDRMTQAGFVLPPGTVHNFAPTNGKNFTLWMLSANAASDMTGILAEPHGTTHLLLNNGGFVINLYNQNPGSVAANQLIAPGNVGAFALHPWRAIWMVYEGVYYNRWILLNTA